MPRVAPVTGKSEVPAEHHAVVDDVLKVFGNVRGPFSMLLHSPKLAERVLPLVTFFRDESVVDAKLRSIAILSAVREREAAYVWAAQVGAARRNGLREEVIDLLRAKGDPAKLPAEERDIVTYVRQLMRTNRVDPVRHQPSRLHDRSEMAHHRQPVLQAELCNEVPIRDAARTFHQEHGPGATGLGGLERRLEIPNALHVHVLKSQAENPCGIVQHR